MAGMNNDKQTLNRISEEVVSIVAAKATLRVPGVSHLIADNLTNNLTKKILGKEKLNEGIVLSKLPEGLGIDIHLNVEFEAKIPDLAWEVQNSVKETVEKVTGLKVQQVNIHIQGVNLPKSIAQEGQTKE